MRSWAEISPLSAGVQTVHEESPRYLFDSGVLFLSQGKRAGYPVGFSPVLKQR